MFWLLFFILLPIGWFGGSKVVILFSIVLGLAGLFWALSL